MSNNLDPSHHYLRCKRDDGSECTVDLTELEEALNGFDFLEYYFLPATGRTVSVSIDEALDDLDDEEEQERLIPEDAETLPIDRIDSRTRFEWMEEFADSVHSITVRFELTEALRRQKPFRNFKDALLQFPKVQELWFAFEQQKLKAAAIALIEDLDWEILDVVDDRPDVNFSEPQDASVHAPITEEERTWVLRGAWEIAQKGGRTQLALLLKGSKNKDLLKHRLQEVSAYGTLSLLTIPEIENRIDQTIRQGDIALVRHGDLPLIALTPEGWFHIQPWAHREEVRRATMMNESRLKEIVFAWRNRPRDEQVQLLEALKSLPTDQVSPVLEAWSGVSGKDMRSRIEQLLGRHQSH